VADRWLRISWPAITRDGTYVMAAGPFTSDAALERFARGWKHMASVRVVSKEPKDADRYSYQDSCRG
jgi:hypothetical protein